MAGELEVIKGYILENPETLVAAALIPIATGILQRLAYPSADAIGNAFGKTIELATLQHPLSQKAAFNLIGGVVQVGNRLINHTPDEIKELPPEVGVPTVQKLSYYSDHELRDLLIDLLVSNISTRNSVHPTIAGIIERFSVGEAKIIINLAKCPRCKRASCGIKQTGPWPYFTIKAALEEPKKPMVLPSDDEYLNLTPEKRTAQIQKIKNIKGNPFQESRGFKDLGTQYLSDLGSEPIIPNFKQVVLYSTTLRSLGVVEETEGVISNDEIYIRLLERCAPYIAIARQRTNYEPIIENGKLSITEIGKQLLNIVSDESLDAAEFSQTC